MDDDDDNLASHGTPLPDLDDDDIVRKKATQDLTVRDEKGRQRFHGAFTGGFSAGYFNTVGTKEGWEPSNFVSTRANKATSSFQRNPEDFMDDEDFGEYGIAPKKIHTTTNFRDSNKTLARKRTYVHNDEIIPGEAPLKDLVRPVSESIGIRILKELGWRHGQGIGPRVKKKSETAGRMYGCDLGPLSHGVGGNVCTEITFAPEDTLDVPYVPKDNYHGIGYSGLSTQSILNVPLNEEFSLSKTKSWLEKDRKKINIRGQAFGVGAFEDDDEDIYHKDDMSQYDFSEFLGLKTDAKANTSKSLGADKYGSIIKVLEGFSLATQPPVTKKYYPSPEVPKHFVPKTRKSSTIVKQSVSSHSAKPVLGHAVRSIMLGEKPSTMLEASKTAESATSQEASKTVKSPIARRSRFDVGPSGLPVPHFVNSAAFKPFSRDEVKQKRYEDFIKMGCNKAFLEKSQPPSMTEWERQQEMDEFFKAAVFYQPLSKALDSRFESRSHLSVEINLIAPEVKKDESNIVESKVQKDDQPRRDIFEWHPLSLLCKRFNVPNPYPDCEIEGVPNTEKKKKPSLFDSLFPEEVKQSRFTPALKEDMGLQDIGTQGVEFASTEASSCDIMISDSSQPNKQIQETAVPSTSKSEDVEIISPIAAEDILKSTKPPMDLFKEIFQTSSSEESESDAEGKKAKSYELQAPTNKAIENAHISKDITKLSSQVFDMDTSTSKASNTSERKGFGVFANIDLDALNRKRFTKSLDKSPKSHSFEANNSLTEPSPSNAKEIKETTEVVHLSDSDDQKMLEEEGEPTNVRDDLFYGPAPPPPDFTPSNTHCKSYKHEKHKHKHKKEKKKKKRKKKKYSKKESDDESSSIDSEEDIPASRIIEKLKALKSLKKR